MNAPGRNLQLYLVLLLTVSTACAAHDESSLTATACFDCHAQDMERTTLPNHRESGFPQTCGSCHSRDDWKPATFDHSVFPLVGAHAKLACNACHQDGKKLASACTSCHEKDIPTGGLPNHQQVGFPRDCAACHGTAGWTPATFDHDQYWGLGRRHNVSCDNCHVDPQSIKNFSCYDGCHRHSKAGMDREHRNRSGYDGTSAGCVRCHRRG